MRLYSLYYNFKGFIPRRLQIVLRRALVWCKHGFYNRRWPIALSAGRRPPEFPGWPEGKRFALVLRHDVECDLGRDKCDRILDLERPFALKSAFFLVPEGYAVPRELRDRIQAAGGEVGVHGLKHDGKLYSSRSWFSTRAVRINRYLREWGAVGFASPSAHHELDWLHELEIEFDSSTFDTDPFEPQPDATHTIYPFVVQGPPGQRDFIELPYTLPQDFTLLILMKQTDISLWKRKLDWIASCGGMALLNTHPDYMRFRGEKADCYTYPARLYNDFLEYVVKRYAGQYWNVPPREVASYWRSLGAPGADSNNSPPNKS